MKNKEQIMIDKEKSYLLDRIKVMLFSMTDIDLDKHISFHKEQKERIMEATLYEMICEKRNRQIKKLGI